MFRYNLYYISILSVPILYNPPLVGASELYSIDTDKINISNI